ncbi:hypothetical protein [Natronincola ferrireducens]|uniref:Uncharacterized protein n=1 Tax=Natronincola ferrireducens TaxID=393762 RepID=A0A1G9F406_9FIRM|nr:hypothetical protein [Natronincola ferrireducens]SDK83097.1 hypothetical protein SAMN05660472_02078 [Natronincola ferrireducens]
MGDKASEKEIEEQQQKKQLTEQGEEKSLLHNKKTIRNIQHYSNRIANVILPDLE